jgi:anti-sigma factor RsiW
MTTCPTETAKLEYLNGETSGLKAAEFEVHLAACPACRAEMADLGELLSGFKEVPLPEAPAALVEAAKAALAKAALKGMEERSDLRISEGRNRYFRWFNLAAGAAIFAAAVILAVVFPVRISSASITALFRIPADLPLSAATLEFVQKFLALLPLLFVPSIVENVRFLIRRKKKSAPLRPRLFLV